MITSFADQLTEDVFHGRDTKRARKFPKQLHRAAQIRLTYLNRARSLQDLKIPPGNRFESLKGDFSGKYSIRINDQWRILFEWTDQQPTHVKITDYH